MLSDQEKTLTGEDQAPDSPASDPSPDSFSAPKLVLPEEDPADDFVFDIPSHVTGRPAQKQPKPQEEPAEPVPESEATEQDIPTAEAPPAEEVEAPSQTEDAPEDPAVPPPAKKGLFGMLAGLRLRFTKKDGEKKPKEKKPKEKKPKKEKPPKEKKEKKAKAPKPEATAAGEGSGDLVDPTQEGAGVAPPKAKSKPTALARPQKDDSAGDDPAGEEAEKGKKKPKKEKKSKEKKTKEKKPKPAKNSGEAPEKKKGSKKLIIIIIIAVVVVGAGVFVALTLLRETPEDVLLKAQTAVEQGDYETALELFSGLLEDETLAPDAYLGLAEALVAAEDVEGAIEKLALGFEATGDLRLDERLQELLPEEVPEDGESSAPVYSSQPIAWTDPALEQMIRRAIEKPAGAISESDLSGITTLKILGAEHVTTSPDGLNSINTMRGYTLEGVEYTELGEITSLADLVHLKNLRRLTVGYNRVGSLEGIEALTQLELLALYVNEVEDITPLAGLSSLKNLYLYGNSIEDISALKGLTGLRVLSVQHNQIVDLAPIAGMTNLRELYISNNQIVELAPLAGMTELIFLNAQSNQIADISVLEGLTKLTDINFQDNPVRDLSPAGHVQNKQSSFA